MEELLNQSELKVGDVVKGEVVNVTDKHVYVDLHQFTEGSMYINAYDPKLESFKGVVALGDEVEAVVMKVDEEHSSILLSRLPLLKKQANAEMAGLCQGQEVIKVKFTKNVGRGLVGSYLGNEVFVPVSQVALEKEVNLDEYVGKTYEVKLVKFEAERRQYVASIRDLLWAARVQAKEAELASINVGDVKEGTVVKVDERLGAFVRFDLTQGLVRRSELSHVRYAKVEDVVKVGDAVTVKVLKVEEGKIDLSIKALQDTPYQAWVKNVKVSDVVEGTIVQKLPYGAIVELAPNVSGLLHVSEITWNPNDNKYASMKIGQTVNPAIISLDDKKERIGLSLKTLEDNPWGRVKANVGDQVEATVTEIVSGKCLKVSALGVDGVIDARDCVLGEKSNKLEDYYAVGDTVKGIITFLDTRAWKLEISIKKLTTQIEREQFEEYMAKEAEKEAETATTLGDIFGDILKK